MNANTCDSESSSKADEMDVETVGSGSVDRDEICENNYTDEGTLLEENTLLEGLEANQISGEEQYVVDSSSSRDVENQMMENHHQDEASSLSSQGTGISYDQRVARHRRLLQQQEEATLQEQEEEENGLEVMCAEEGAFVAAGNDELTVSQFSNGADIQKNLGNRVAASFEADNELTSIRKNEDGTGGVGTMSVAAVASTSVVMDQKPNAPPTEVQQTQEMQDEGSSPGAYQVPGRAFGQFPAWGQATQNRQGVWDSQRSGVQVEDNDESSASLGQERRRSAPKVAAIVVDEEELQNRVRQDLLEETVRADIVDCCQINEDAFKRLKRRYLLAAAFAVVLVAVVVGLSVGLTMSSNREDADQTATVVPTLSPPFDSRPTLEIVRERGYIICGVYNLSGFFRDNAGNYSGFEMDLCRAVAVTVFDDVDRVEPAPIEIPERFVTLGSRSIDLLAARSTHTMDRDIHERNSEVGFSFSTPYLYDGMRFAGEPPFGKCADNRDSYEGQCRYLRVCVLNGTTHVPIVQSLFPEPTIVIVNDARWAFVNGNCNAMAQESFGLAERTIRGEPYNYKGLYEIGTNLYSKEPLALVTRDNDPEWSGIMDWVVQSLLAAEYNNITNDTVGQVIDTAGGDVELFAHVIETVGNYGEMYERHLEQIVPRNQIDRINKNGTTGLIYSNPLGRHENEGPGPDIGGTLERVFNSSMLSCGIVLAGERFADYDNETEEWSGLDADFCQAVCASALNQTNPDLIFVLYNSTDEGLLGLSSGSVDIMTGVDRNAEGVRFTVSHGSIYSTSPPYYYDPPLGVTSKTVRTRTIATRRDDVQWSDFVSWVVSSTFLAQENYINQSESMKMPAVNLFGPSHKQMLQKSVGSVGSFGEIYDRNNVSRVGRNQLNKNPFGPQHFTFPLP